MTRVAILSFGAATLCWQPPRDTLPQPRSTGTIRGRVVAAATGDPIRNARVSVTDDQRSPVLSDAEGRFAFPDVPPGRFTLTASKAGFAKQAFGRAVRPPPRLERIVRSPGDEDWIPVSLVRTT